MEFSKNERTTLYLNLVFLLLPVLFVYLPWGSFLSGNFLFVLILFAALFYWIILFKGLKISWSYLKNNASNIKTGQKILLFFPLINAILLILSFTLI